MSWKNRNRKNRNATPGYDKMPVACQSPAGANAEPPPRTVAIHTHGCKLNQSDSQTLARRFREAGYTVVGASDAADVVVLNTCTVTAAADAKARQFLRAARRRNPGAVVVATGCYAQRAPAELEKLPEVSLTVGNTGKPSLVELAGDALRVRSAPVAFPSGRAGASGRTRAMVKIQEGCNQVCAYCIVPKVRGRESSVPSAEIVSEINRHTSDGCREVALTGTQLGSYGFDIPGEDLVGLLKRVLAETSVERLRVSSLQAHEISPLLLELWRDSRLMPHFHIPLQSGCDDTLRAMRRRYDTSQFSASVEMVRGMYPDAGITTDVIVGFPGETSRDFSASLGFAAAMRFSDMHVFPYSQRPGTSAAYLVDQVAEQEKRSRMGEMLALAAEASARFRQGQIEAVRMALWERGTAGGGWSGLTDNYLRVRSFDDRNLSNRITPARLVGLEGNWLVAEVPQ